MHIDNDTMIAWSKDVQHGRSTVDEPSGLIISMLTRKKEMKKGSRKKTPSPPQDTRPSDSQLMRDALTAGVTMTSNLMAIMTASLGVQMGVNKAGGPAIGLPQAVPIVPTVVPPSLPTASSPIRPTAFMSQDELIHSFFDWYIEKYRPKETIRHQLCQVRDNMIEEDWDIDELRPPGKQSGQGGSMTSELWKSLGGPLDHW
jgi:hypothetical protein